MGDFPLLPRLFLPGEVDVRFLQTIYKFKILRIMEEPTFKINFSEVGKSLGLTETQLEEAVNSAPTNMLYDKAACDAMLNIPQNLAEKRFIKGIYDNKPYVSIVFDENRISAKSISKQVGRLEDLNSAIMVEKISPATTIDAKGKEVPLYSPRSYMNENYLDIFNGKGVLNPAVTHTPVYKLTWKEVGK